VFILEALKVLIHAEDVRALQIAIALPYLLDTAPRSSIISNHPCQGNLRTVDGVSVSHCTTALTDHHTKFASTVVNFRPLWIKSATFVPQLSLFSLNLFSSKPYGIELWRMQFQRLREVEVINQQRKNEARKYKNWCNAWKRYIPPARLKLFNFVILKNVSCEKCAGTNLNIKLINFYS
jgi:hypothetical protein